jgi:hypothetical protein
MSPRSLWARAAATPHIIERHGKSFRTPVALHLKMGNGKIRHLHLQLREDTLLIARASGQSAVVDRGPTVVHYPGAMVQMLLALDRTLRLRPGSSKL